MKNYSYKVFCYDGSINLNYKYISTAIVTNKAEATKLFGWGETHHG